MRYLVTCRYNGTKYYGWQKQPEAVTIQGVIEQTLSTFFNVETKIYGSGRTDAGVHAIGQTFHFDGVITDLDKFIYSINKMLPGDIELLSIKKVKADFHARHHAKEKIYRYGIELKAKDPFLQDFRLLYPYPFNLALFSQSLALFIGTHNFSAFTSKPSDEANFVRTIFDIKVKKRQSEVVIDFFGSGFMNGQIRMMIGTALAVASEKINLDYITNRLNQQDRNITSYKADSQGLYLIRVKY